MIAIPEILQNDGNADVLPQAAGGSLHGDLGEKLVAALRQLDDAKYFYNTEVSFGSLVGYVGKKIFAYGEGMQAIHLKLSDQEAGVALELGDCMGPADIKGWYRFSPFRENFDEWVSIAYIEAQA